MIEFDPYNPSDDPLVTIRADLWPTMTLGELTNQQDLVLTRLSKLSTIMGGSPPQSYRDMYGALQTAMNDLNRLIDYHTSNKQ